MIKRGLAKNLLSLRMDDTGLDGWLKMRGLGIKRGIVQNLA
jgi:hypothetical protein